MTAASAQRPLRLEAVQLAVGGRALFAPLSATVVPGHCLTVMGPSGCGKSSLLGFMAGTLDAAFESRGEVFVGPLALAPLPPERRRLGMLFQDDLLFPHLSVGGNLGFALPAAVRRAPERSARIDAALADAGLAGFAARDPATLSGGQRARVALMRTLLAEPVALLLDEPFSKLDTALRADFRSFVFAHARSRGLPVVLVSHDEADARAAGGEVVAMRSLP
jgi:putative thiamine transport system ATP-binding protein